MLEAPGKEEAEDVGARRWIAVLLAVVVAAAGCAPKRITLDDRGAAGIGVRAVELAKEQIGVPYAFGGSQPDRWLDLKLSRALANGAMHLRYDVKR